MAVSNRFSRDATHELSVLGSVVAALGGSASLVAVFCGSHVLADTYGDYLASGYDRKLVESPIFDLQLLKPCLQKVSSSVFAPLDPFSMTEFFVTRLKGAEHGDWMMSRSSLRRAIITGQLCMPSFPEVISNTLDVGPFIWFTSRRLGKALKATTQWYYNFLCFIPVAISSCCFVLEEGNRWPLLHQQDGEKQLSPVSPDPRTL